ncbi:MAG TPA: CAP domain-containing protein [Acidimicrobiales bacterium]|nr:CAP domain-containing protein [Acidimicrobiales bacterium]
MTRVRAGVRWALAGAGIVLLALVVVAPSAGAQVCGFDGRTGCPGSPHPRPEPRRPERPERPEQPGRPPGRPPQAPPTTSTTRPAPPPSTSTSSTSTTLRTLAPAEAAARLLVLLNHERERAGLARLALRDDVAAIASGWTRSMARVGRLSHNDEYFTKRTRGRLDARRLGENVAYGGDVDRVHRALMASTPHRANILDSRFGIIGIGAELHDGTWWVTEDFVQSNASQPTESRRAWARRPSAGPASAAVAPIETAPRGRDRDVLASAGAEPVAAVLGGASRPAGRSSTLVGERTLDPVLPLSLLAAGAGGGACVLVARRRRADADNAIQGSTDVDLEPEDAVPVSDVYDQLAVIGAWARTLDDRWATLSECDRRIATQIIRRTTDATLHELQLAST